MIVVAHNLLAANANRQLGITTEEQKKSSEKLSSGYRINRAADDAAGLSISEKLRYQVRGLERGQKNTMDGVSWCQVGDGALQEIQEMVQRIRELAVQASNDTNTPTNASRLAKINLNTTDYTKVSYHGQEKPNSANRSQFKSVVVKTPQRYGIHIQNSSNVGDNLLIEKFAMNTVELGLFAIHTRDYEGAQKTIGACDNAMAVLNDRRSYFGASQNRLEHTYANSANAEENQQAAESRIRDTDMAEEMVKYSKNNILAQAGQSMLAQANQGTQGILNLLQ